MWKGIILLGNAKLIINSSTISDAEYAARIMAVADIDIRQSDFVDNYVGIYYEPGVTHSGLFNVDECEFKGTGTLTGPYQGQTTNLGTTPLAGIIVYNFNGFTLTSNSAPNLFERMNSGLLLYDCISSISNFVCTAIQPDPVMPAYIYSGCGIYSSNPNTLGNTITVQGFGYSSSDLNFSGCLKAIRAEEGNAFISDCNIGPGGPHGSYYEAMNGIQYLYGQNQTAYITNNVMEVMINGINMEYIDGANEISISGNSINVGNPNRWNSSGIRINNFGSFIGHGANNRYHLFHNYIYCNEDVNNGIQLLNLNNFYVEDNHIYLNNNFRQFFGMKLSNSNQNEINCNEVVSYDNPFYPIDDQASIYATKSSDNKFGCNSVENTTRGFAFDEDCPNSEIFGNTIGNHNVGLYVGNFGVIGQQPLVYPGSDLPGNIWTGTYNLWGAQDLNTGNISRYWYDNSGPYWQFGPPSVDPPAVWMIFVPDNNFECGPYTVDGQYMDHGFCEPANHEFAGGSSTLDQKIAEDSLNFASYDSEMQWSLKKYLFEKLRFGMDSVSIDSSFITFYDSVFNTTIKDFADVKEKEIEFFEPDVAVLSYVNQKQLIIQQNLALLMSYQIALNDPNLSSQNYATLLLDIDALQQNISSLRSLVELALSQLNSGRQIIANTTDAINQNIYTSETIELNLKEIKDIYWNTIAIRNYHFSVSQVSTIQQIAEQCPIAGGEAVYLARGLNALINPDSSYDDHTICLQQGIIFRKKVIENNKSKCYLMPNPANNQVTIYYQIGNANNIFRIYDSVGRAVKSSKLDPNGNSQTIDVSGFVNGAYTVKLIEEDSVVFQDKLIILK